MFCSNCGASVAENAPYCSNCGRPAQNLMQTPPAAPPAGMAYTGLPQTDGKATGSMVLGILSLVGFWLLAAIPAIILGHISRKEIRESRGRLTGDGMALAGLIMGYISAAALPVILIVLIFAGIAIPNLLHSRKAANDSAAASTLRTLNTVQVTYSATYPHEGYARDLATLGPGPGGDCEEGTAQNACLLDSRIASPDCTAGTWCTKSGFRFSMTTTCKAGHVCSDYVVVATPVNSSTGNQTFCSTADAIIRFKRGVISEPLSTAEECKEWEPVS